MGKLLKYEKNVINCTDLCKIIALGEEHFEQSCFDISVDLRRRLMNSKDEFMFYFVFVLLYRETVFSMLLCLLGEVISYLFYRKRPTVVK